MRVFFNNHRTRFEVGLKILLCYRRNFIPLLVLLFSFVFELKAQNQDTIVFQSYNLLNYPSAGGAYASDTTTRHPHYRTILNAINPDILVVQEMNSQVGMNGFLNNVLNASTNTYSAGPFIDGYDTDNGIFYKTDKFHSPSNSPINTELRDISEFKLVHTLSGDTLRIYSVHLKASSGSTNEAQRGREVDSLRKVTNALPAGTNFIVCGDFNIYGSTETAYQKLLFDNGMNEGHFIDPISMTGTWNQGAYAIHHTQSPRTRAFGGGSTGGMDDRFDLILYSEAISLGGGVKFIANSEIAYGNDGTLYNDSINHPSNTAVPPAIANALHYAADHIPVISKFTFEYNAGVTPTDFGITALLDPISPMCSNANQSISVSVKNFGALPVDFSTDNLSVEIKVTDPSMAIQYYSETLTSGILNAGAVMTVNVTAMIDMSVAGTYVFKCNSSQINDANHLNDTLSPVNIAVTSSTTASISPSGPISICSGDFTTLTSSSGVSYLWSNNETTQSISVSDTGNYSVQVTISGGCTSSSNTVQVNHIIPPANGIVFYESMGVVSSTTSISSHENNDGFDNDPLTMSGTGDVRVTSSSSGYSGSSGGANVFFTASGRVFTISGINTLGYSNLQLSHGLHKNSTSSDGTDLVVEVSSNGIDFTPLTPTPVNTGAGTANWHYRTVTGTIPSVPSLTIQFRHNNGTAQFRVDDITLSGSSGNPGITASGSTNICLGDSVVLTASSGNSYLWNTGSTTQSITVTSSGSYFSKVDCVNSDTVTVIASGCQPVTLNLKAFIQGFYIGNQIMAAVSDPIGQPSICDTITVELAEVASPNIISHSSTSLLSTTGTGSFTFPPSVLNNSFYVVVKHRNTLETWSANPIFFNDTNISYDFTTSLAKAYGNNLINVDGEYCLFSGDVSDGVTNGAQDGVIDDNDFNDIENSLQFFLSGYTINDLTGDQIVESADFSLIGNNIDLGIILMRP